MEMQIPKGTFDILPYGTEETWRLSHLWQFVEGKAHEIATQYGYGEIRTPIYERKELFCRGVGETSDIVTKEMFTFQDKAGREMTLRPEGTSSVMRSFLENRLNNLGAVHKFYYIGPMFRYERPQSGRYRQHHQFGVEAIGAAGPEMDAEVIDLLYQFYVRLGLKNLKVHLNTVGDTESRTAFRKALLSYLKPHFSQLSEESQTRFEKNPLRILDSKDPKDREILKNAPSILDSLTPPAKEHFAHLQHLLKTIQIPYAIDDKIVRGLDYYTSTVFEILSQDLGAQNTIGAGGRFDELIQTFGGPSIPAVGFATGLERVLQTLISQQKTLPKAPAITVYFIPLGGEGVKEKCFSLATACRHAGISAEIELHAKKIQNAFQNAERKQATYCAIVGEEELKKGALQLKHLPSREQREVSFPQLIAALKG